MCFHFIPIIYFILTSSIVSRVNQKLSSQLQVHMKINNKHLTCMFASKTAAFLKSMLETRKEEGKYDWFHNKMDLS